MDRFSEKYDGLTPYHYTAGNPINLVDINGDSIFVSTGESGDNFLLFWGFTEKQGFGLYNSKNEIYKGNNSFVNAVSHSLSLLNLSKQGSDFLTSVSGAKERVTLEKTDKRNVTQNSRIYLNPSRTDNTPTEDGFNKSPFFITVGHELAHGYANATGAKFSDWINIPTVTGSRTLSTSEIYASHIENQLRSGSGQPLRTHYSANTFGDNMPTTRLLDFSGASLHFKKGDSKPNQIQLKKIDPTYRYKYR